MKVLLAEDEKSIALTLGDELEAAHHEVVHKADGLAALDAALNEHFDVVISDIRMPNLDGEQLLARLKEARPDLPVVLMTGFGTMESVIKAMRLGAYDYLQKPFDTREAILILERLAKVQELQRKCDSLQRELEDKYRFENIIGASPKMQSVYSLIRAAATNDFPVLITGETGTGKELVAHAIHVNSARRKAELVKVSCHNFPETLLESELFGHEKGAFTDAKEQKIGRFERAHRGTIFIDDIDDMPPGAQAKILNVLQEKKIERLGGTRTTLVDIRIIVATKTDLMKMVNEGRFRNDLFYRLNVVPIDLPPMRERDGDIPLLIREFIRKHGAGKNYQISPQTMGELEHYGWPGNVRELEGSVQRAIALSGDTGELRREHLIRVTANTPKDHLVRADRRPLKDVLSEAERGHIMGVLKICNGKKGEAAELLGISRKNLWEKLKAFGVDAGGEDTEK
ncbi:MAG: sigma-54-dependent Fis family transcriptional regulator [Candidatus Brocadiae bacterium]|nr:sigma-54-dependent Fis family transcriptional regulator [Candidatus Brocadiia bacterium]